METADSGFQWVFVPEEAACGAVSLVSVDAGPRRCFRIVVDPVLQCKLGQCVGLPPVTLAEEAGQEVLPGGGPRLHQPAFSIVLRSDLNYSICSFHRPGRAESLRAPLPRLCQVPLAG
ncbi:hypothetical protein KUCAC02_006303 [Chaenocephalus aceratus]|uniref:Uncharacterized protein n=1 Tax=Chaenocephalus aceratus TaxID=36190 RepID=A0ACB9VRY6_CHAAC|nr:hypothetical protein KUCAC02_006303 [Chaenocephalus aceratus]